MMPSTRPAPIVPSAAEIRAEANNAMGGGFMVDGGKRGRPFECPFCHAVSHHPSDERERYCVRCKVFADDVLATPADLRRAIAAHTRRIGNRPRATRDETDQAERTARAWESGL